LRSVIAAAYLSVFGREQEFQGAMHPVGMVEALFPCAYNGLEVTRTIYITLGKA